MSESSQRMEKSATVRIDAVKLGDRHRRDLGDVNALVRSIQDIGLLHPIVITPDMELIAGARRLEAYRRIGRTDTPTLRRHCGSPVGGSEGIQRSGWGNQGV